MDMSNVQSIVEPDPVQMRRHVSHLFEGWLDGCQEGRIELAWTDGRDGRLKHAAIFGTDQLDELVERAVAENRRPGQNVYIGAALRKPDTAPFGRCGDEDFFALTAYYVDIDDDVTQAAAAKCRERGCPPTAVVITGRHPHVRAQLYWRLSEPQRDPDICRAQNSALAQTLGGDPSVVNPSRVLRLGGSIAWPTKDGRVVERTESRDFSDARPKAYMPEQMAKASPHAQPSLSEQMADTSGQGKSANASSLSTKTPTIARSATLNIGTSSLSVDDYIARIRAGDRWHDNMLRLVGHWIARGWSDAEIQTAAEAMTLPGYTVADTRRDVGQMIAGGRAKWNKPDIARAIEVTDSEQRPTVIDPRTWSGKPLPQRKWLVENWVPMNYVTALFGDGGLGKTLLAQQLLTSVATGQPWLGQPVRQLRAFGLLCEDHEDDLHINQDRIDAAYGIDYQDLGDLRFWPSVGFDNLLMTFDGQATGKGQLTQFFDALLGSVIEFGARFVVLDTAADLFGGNENIRSQVRQFITNACGRIAREIDGAVLLCAHPSLSGMASGSGSSGSTAWNNTVRSRLYLTQAAADNGEEADPDARVLTRKKSNYARAGETLALRWTEGVMMPSDADADNDDATTRSLVLEEIDRAWRDGQPYSDAPQARSRFILTRLPARTGLSRGAVERAYLALLDSGHIRLELHDSHKNFRGLKATRRTEELKGVPS
jgi:RecA-family ATPase